MDFKLKKACDNCPFLDSEARVQLTPGRAGEIAQHLEYGDGAFTCHKTLSGEHDEEGGQYVPGGGEQHCAGALSIAQRLGWPSFVPRLAAAMGLFDIENFEADGRTFATYDDFVKANCDEAETR